MDQWDLHGPDNQVAIHNKNGQGLLPNEEGLELKAGAEVAIHNKNGQGLLHLQAKRF